MVRTGRAETALQGRLVGAAPQDRPQGGPRPQRLWICRRSPTNRRNGCSLPVRVPEPSPLKPWHVQHVIAGSAIGRNSAVVVLEC